MQTLLNLWAISGALSTLLWSILKIAYTNKWEPGDFAVALIGFLLGPVTFFFAIADWNAFNNKW